MADKCKIGGLAGAVAGGVANLQPSLTLIEALGDGLWGLIAGALVEAASTLAGGAVGGVAAGCFDEPKTGPGQLVGIQGPGWSPTRMISALLFVPLLAGGILSHSSASLTKLIGIVLAEGATVCNFGIVVYLLWKRRHKS
jgi:hypothetical protein